MPVVLASDLHLPAEPSPLREGFLHWLAGPARQASAVYLLGDLFEVWIGDDLGLAVYAEEIAALRTLTAAGTPVYVQRGNRDFLLGAAFERASGARLLADPQRLVLGGVPTLLSHGDQWCTADVGYLRWRRFAHTGWIQRLFLALPPRWRQRIAGDVRQRSRVETARKPAAITDVDPQAVLAAMRAAGVTRVIHGHTHRPQLHRLELDGQPAERLVLPDWRPGVMGGWAIEAGGGLRPL
jgi:UDP-2,3-diacylglucosamine hydrolase